MFFTFSHFHYFFVTHGHKPAIFNFFNRNLSDLWHSLSPQHSKTYLQGLETKPKTYLYIIIYYGKVKETYLISVIRAKIL